MPTDITASSLALVSHSPELTKIARLLGFEVCEAQLPAADTIVLAFKGSPDEEAIRSVMDTIAEDCRLLVVFQAREKFIASSAWSPASRFPCPFCVIDFALDRVFYDPKDTHMGLSDVYDLTRSFGADEPHIPVSDADIAFVLRFVRQHTDALAGTGFAGFEAFDPLMASAIDFVRLNRQAVRIPLSPLCDCIQRYPLHHSKGEPCMR